MILMIGIGVLAIAFIAVWKSVECEALKTKLAKAGDEIKEAGSEIESLEYEHRLLKQINEEYYTKIMSLLSPSYVTKDGKLKEASNV